MFCIMSVAESRELHVNLHFYIYWMINLKIAIFFIRIIITAYCFWTATCKPGTSWRRDCNTCTCNSRGVPVCTMKACLNRLKRQVSCKFNMKKHSDKLNSSPPKDYGHLEHVAVCFGGYLALL